MKASVENSPSQLAAATAMLEKAKAVEKEQAVNMTTVRLNRFTVVSCLNANKIDEYKKSLNIKC